MSPFEADSNRLQALFQAGHYVELEALAQTVLARQPQAGGIWYLLGQTYLAQGRLQAARQALERASMLLSDQAPVWSVLAACQNALGERQEAARCFERSLALDSSHAEIWAHAGRNALELGRHKEAERYCGRALALQPGMAEAQYNLAHAFKAQGRIDESLGAFRRVRELAPAVAEAHNAVALGLLELGQAEEALAACRCALELKPGLIDAMVNLGSALSALRCYEEAAMAYQDALAQNPDLAEAHSNLGNVLWELGRPEAAIAAYRRALQLKPDFAEASLNLGNALSDLDDLNEALAAYQQALELRPGFVEARYGLGRVLERMKRFEEAIAVFRANAEQASASAEAYLRLGGVLQAAERHDEAIAAYAHAIESNPRFIEAYRKLGGCFTRLGRLDEAVAVYRNGLQLGGEDPGLHSDLLFVLNYSEAGSLEVMLAEARTYGERVAIKAAPAPAHGNAPEPSRRLRIGLVSGDFGDHPVGYFIEHVVANIDSKNLELFAYETYKRKGALNERLHRLIPRWRDAAPGRLPDDATLAQLIREDGIDILIDLAGHTAHNRLPVFAWKPAPVQVTWLGYFATTGLVAMDYILADRWVLPSKEEKRFIERPWHLPDSYYCFTPPNVRVDVGTLPTLKNGHITFGCFNNLAKVNDRVIACWARVLESTPGSRLFLKTKALGDVSVAAGYRERFARHGIEPERLHLEGASPRDEYLAAYNAVDIALDPFPFPGGTTSVEGLWMGVPVLTLEGNCFIGHQGETILHSVGLQHWIAADEDEYVAKAMEFSRDHFSLTALRAGLRGRLLASPLCDAPRFARNLENALRGMWQKWCEQQASAKAVD